VPHLWQEETHFTSDLSVYLNREDLIQYSPYNYVNIIALAIPD